MAIALAASKPPSSKAARKPAKPAAPKPRGSRPVKGGKRES
jgi:hypothetical protein